MGIWNGCLVSYDVASCRKSIYSRYVTCFHNNFYAEMYTFVKWKKYNFRLKNINYDTFYKFNFSLFHIYSNGKCENAMNSLPTLLLKWFNTLQTLSWMLLLLAVACFFIWICFYIAYITHTVTIMLQNRSDCN